MLGTCTCALSFDPTVCIADQLSFTEINNGVSVTSVHRNHPDNHKVNFTLLLQVRTLI